MLDLSKLNEAQRRAVTHSEGPAMVLAGPGSGKTHLVISRITYLIEKCQVPPDTILVITFTKAAADSMQRRFELSTDSAYPGVWFGTFHSFFYQILKTYASYDNQSLVTTKEKISYLKEVFTELSLPWEESAHLQEYMSLEQKGKVSVSLLPDGVSLELLEKIRESFVEKMFQDKKLDFDDMAVLCERLLEKNHLVREELCRKHRYIVIDEYQDINQAQENVIGLLTGNAGELMVVGDDDQAIYGFRGSDPGIMQNFEQRYPGAGVYYLNQNYRSAKKIVSCGEKIIAENKNRFVKHMEAVTDAEGEVNYVGYETATQEYEAIATRIKELEQKISLSEMVVIARSNRELEILSTYLGQKGIACALQGKESKLCEHFVAVELLQCVEFIGERRLRAPSVWRKLGGDERKRSFLAKQSPYVVLHFIYKKMGYERFLLHLANHQFQNSEVEKELKLSEWKNIAFILMEHSKTYKGIIKWLEDVEDYLESYREEQSGQKEESVKLITMHASKGLEFEYVCLINMNEGTIPGKKSRTEEAIEEERRLLYVGMTRAKKILDILYLTGSKEYPRLPSRFLKPILENDKADYSASSTSSSNSTLSKNSSNASATASYSSSSSI